MLTAPNRSLDQRMAALRHANEIRSARSALKRNLKARRESLLPLVIDPPAYLHTARVSELLLAMPKVGQVKANRILNATRLSPSKTLGGMSKRQRVELARILIERRM